MKVLLVTPVPPPYHGGIINWTGIVQRELGAKPDLEMGFVDTAVRFRAVTNKSLSLRLVGGSAQAIRDTYRVRRRLKVDKPDVVHLCTSGGPATLKDIAILRIARAFGVPSAIHYRMGRFPKIVSKSGTEWKLTRRAMSLADVVITLDKRSEESVKGALPEARVVTLPNIVEIDAIDAIRKRDDGAPLPTGLQRIVHVGHVVPAKGIRELVEAAARLSDRSLALDLVGPVGTSFKEELLAIASRTGATDWLRFHGAVDHETALQYLLSADLFVLPSYTEGAPNVILEAMACRKAIIGTTVGAIPEMLDNGGPEECGVCIEPQDVDGLTSAIERLLDSPDRARELGRKARERAEKLYDVPVACGKLVDLWKSLAK